jgi:hypothetical protein
MASNHRQDRPTEASVTRVSAADPRIFVMEWLLEVGKAAASRLRAVPPTALAQGHEP